jgi:hypothetical protein
VSFAAAAAVVAAAAGLALQLCGIGLLLGWQDAWAANGEVTKGILFVTAAQMLCGVAKDLTKLGGKTVTKLVTPDEREVRAGWLAIVMISHTTNEVLGGWCWLALKLLLPRWVTHAAAAASHATSIDKHATPCTPWTAAAAAVTSV